MRSQRCIQCTQFRLMFVSLHPRGNWSRGNMLPLQLSTPWPSVPPARHRNNGWYAPEADRAVSPRAVCTSSFATMHRRCLTTLSKKSIRRKTNTIGGDETCVCGDVGGVNADSQSNRDAYVVWSRHTHFRAPFRSMTTRSASHLTSGDEGDDSRYNTRTVTHLSSCVLYI